MAKKSLLKVPRLNVEVIGLQQRKPQKKQKGHAMMNPPLLMMRIEKWNEIIDKSKDRER